MRASRQHRIAQTRLAGLVLSGLLFGFAATPLAGQDAGPLADEDGPTILPDDGPVIFPPSTEGLVNRDGPPEAREDDDSVSRPESGGTRTITRYSVRFLAADELHEKLKFFGTLLTDTTITTFGGGIEEVPFAGERRRDQPTDPDYARTTARSPLDMLIIEADVDRLPRILALLERIDVPRPQVVLDTQVIEFTYTSGFQLGFEFDLDRSAISETFWQGFDLNYNPVSFLESLPLDQPPPFQGTTASFGNSQSPSGTSALRFGLANVAIRALQTNGQAEILANPRLLVNESETGRIFSGEQVFIQTTSSRDDRISFNNRTARDAGITLDLKPIIIADGSVRLRVRAEVSEITGFVSSAAGSIPIISSRIADTLAQVEDRQTLVIGGLILKQTTIDTRGIPILADIPFIGQLFRHHDRSRSRTEVIFMITPHIRNIAARLNDGRGR